MNGTTRHLSPTQLETYLDGAVSSSEHAVIEQHLAACEGCRRAFNLARHVDNTLRTLPQERVEREFTGTVLQVLHLVPRTSLGFRILENIAYVFGLMIVITVMLTVFTVAGVIEWGELLAVPGAAGNTVSAVSAGISGVIDSFAHFVRTYAPFLFAKDGRAIIASMLGVAALIALVDYLLGKRILQR